MKGGGVGEEGEDEIRRDEKELRREEEEDVWGQ